MTAKALCFACRKSIEIGTGHYLVCKVRIKIDELDKKYKKAKLSLDQVRSMAIRELKNEV